MSLHISPLVNKSRLSLDHAFLVALALFDEDPSQPHLDFYLSANMMEACLDLEDSEWELIFNRIEATLKNLASSSIHEVAIHCTKSAQGSFTYHFCDPNYHDLEFARLSLAPQSLAHAG